jgi:translation initiation factor eIF-2B subunit beta
MMMEKVQSQFENIEYVVEFKKTLRKKSYPNSSVIAIETAKIFKEVIKYLYTLPKLITLYELLKVLRTLGKSFISVDPLQFSVGNMVKRILHIVREESNKYPNLQSSDNLKQESDIKKKRLMSMTSLNLLIDYSNQKIVQTPRTTTFKAIYPVDDEDGYNNYDTNSINNNMNEDMKEFFKAVLTSITELIEEIESVNDLKDHSVEHINDNDVILTANHSDLLEEFFIEAAKSKTFHVVIAESAPTLK